MAQHLPEDFRVLIINTFFSLRCNISACRGSYVFCETEIFIFLEFKTISSIRKIYLLVINS